MLWLKFHSQLLAIAYIAIKLNLKGRKGLFHTIEIVLNRGLNIVLINECLRYCFSGTRYASVHSGHYPEIF